jgi:hypothetical protein
MDTWPTLSVELLLCLFVCDAKRSGYNLRVIRNRIAQAVFTAANM